MELTAHLPPQRGVEAGGRHAALLSIRGPAQVGSTLPPHLWGPAKGRRQSRDPLPGVGSGAAVRWECSLGMEAWPLQRDRDNCDLRAQALGVDGALANCPFGLFLLTLTQPAVPLLQMGTLRAC